MSINAYQLLCDACFWYCIVLLRGFVRCGVIRQWNLPMEMWHHAVNLLMMRASQDGDERILWCRTWIKEPGTFPTLAQGQSSLFLVKNLFRACWKQAKSDLAFTHWSPCWWNDRLVTVVPCCSTDRLIVSNVCWRALSIVFLLLKVIPLVFLCHFCAICTFLCTFFVYPFCVPLFLNF